MQVERRKNLRARVFLPVQVISSARKGFKPKLVLATCRNLGIGGALCLLNEPIGVGCLVKFIIHLPNRKVEGDAIVSRCETSVETGWYRIALCFNDLPIESTKEIDNFVREASAKA